MFSREIVRSIDLAELADNNVVTFRGRHEHGATVEVDIQVAYILGGYAYGLFSALETNQNDGTITEPELHVARLPVEGTLKLGENLIDLIAFSEVIDPDYTKLETANWRPFPVVAESLELLTP